VLLPAPGIPIKIRFLFTIGFTNNPFLNGHPHGLFGFMEISEKLGSRAVSGNLSRRQIKKAHRTAAALQSLEVPCSL
jgi:hypothetical protein